MNAKKKAAKYTKHLELTIFLGIGSMNLTDDILGCIVFPIAKKRGRGELNPRLQDSQGCPPHGQSLTIFDRYVYNPEKSGLGMIPLIVTPCAQAER
jgi:hypothetical protein